MKVLIVAKTRQGGGACIGGITFEGQSVRLIGADAATNEHVGLEYAVGEVWEVDAEPAPQVIPPHVENIVVRGKRRLGTMPGCAAFIEPRMPPQTGGPAHLYEGLAQVAPGGALYVSEAGGIPPYSTTFWRPDRPLLRVEDGKRIRYRYGASEDGPTLVFVGFQEPLAVIPAGALVRVSLAHWWRPDHSPDCELRCYVQLSGWFLPAARELARPDPAPVIDQVVSRATIPASEKARSTLSGAPSGYSGAQSKGVAMAGDAAILGAVASRDSGPVSLEDARHLLKTVFGYDDFRPLQAEIIANLLRGQDALAVMPTGSGKSLCYQLPALVLDGLTVVVSPLISLMQDQVTQLHELGVPAAFLNSTVGYTDYLATAAGVRAGQVKLLYTSPETLLRPETAVLLDHSHVRCMAIDEAHCISEWGHDFRPEYRQLRSVRERYPDAVCIALTATATERVRRDIQQRLGFRDENAFLASFDRPNLFLEVQPRTNGLAQMLAFLDVHRDQSGIIYCGTRDGVDRLAAQLAAHGWSVLPYHAGLDDEARRRNQDLFSRDRVPIIVATIAFGMGINKSNVRFVAHHNLPKDLESYYQEIGRAGRDGLRADCLLLHSRSDMQTIYRFIEEGASAERAGRHARLQAMTRYADARGCRRAQLLAYFGETAAECGFCDNCLSAAGEVTRIDVTAPARLFLTCVQGTGEIFGAGHIVDVLRGSRGQRVLQRRHDRLPMYGAGKDQPASWWRDLAEALIRDGWVEQDMEHGGLRLTTRGREALGGKDVTITIEAPRSVPVVAATAAYDMGLFERLRALRRELADAADVPPYVVFSDRSLAEMATCFPHSPTSLLAIHGVGQRKLAAYGEPFLAAIREYCAEHGLAERAHPVPAAEGPSGVIDGPRRRWQEVGEAFAAGQTIEQLMALYNVKQGTIVEHLYRYVRAGRAFEPARIRPLSKLSAEDQERVLAVFAELGPDTLSPVFAALGGEVAYEELHVLRLVSLLGRAQTPASSPKGD
jgi:ATP-dependent DNA helicase RecQ